MIVFIDDSGDAGFKLDKGSSRFFVIACVIFDDELDAEKIADVIKELKRTQKIPKETEYKFNKFSKPKKGAFLQAVSKFKYTIRCIVIDKKLIRSTHLKETKESFYSYAIKLVLQNSGDSILNAKIRIDGSGDRSFRQSFTTYLRLHLNSKQKVIMKDCKLIDSKQNVLIQLADMVAGSIRRAYEDSKQDSQIYKKIIQKKIKDEWKFQ